MKDRLDNLLVSKEYFESRQKAQYAIKNGYVFVNEKAITKVSKIIEDNCKIDIKDDAIMFVGKGGLKLEKAVNVFNIVLNNKICVDIGASTGGFTDCMLKHGAKKVYAIDVGHDQLDASLKNNEKVINMENTNIKDINVNEFEKIDFISIDVSFISLTNVLNKAYEVLKNNGEVVALIKPQFEAGKEFISKSGVIKDKKIHTKVIQKVLIYADELGFTIKEMDFSPIKGGAGNIEYIVYMKKQEEKARLRYI